ncbi:ATPase AAA [Bacilli bacterium]|nr:ATPase AAA [Bacilli bacterium]
MESAAISTLEHIEKIIEYTDAVGINDLLFEKAHSCIGVVSERLSITPMQTVLLSILFNNFNSFVDTDELSKLLKCPPIKTLHYMNDLDELVKRKLIISKMKDETTVYKVSPEAVTALRRQDVFNPETHRNITIGEFFSVLEDLFESFEDMEFASRELIFQLNILINENMQLVFCQKFKGYNFTGEDKILFLCFCHLYVNNHDDAISFHNYSFLYDRRSKARQVSSALRNGDHQLIHLNLIENTNDDGFADAESYRLTDYAKKELLAELELKEMAVKRKKGLILWETLNRKEMFYNREESQKIEVLTSLLKEENFKKIQNRLTEKGMRNGFACIFLGAPGTGKTETVYQIARETERDIMMVDISNIKGMWVGETEKRIKAVFDDYKTVLNTGDTAPILLFNEADGVFGKRMEFTKNSRAVDRMENTLQNIILQELENLKGILIATTNLTKNLDNAFERRFLYKIEFKTPGMAARQSIWRAMIPTLSETIAGELAARYDLSGGQIENIARKCAVEQVLSGTAPSTERLYSFCDDEKLPDKGQRTIGFTT